MSVNKQTIENLIDKCSNAFISYIDQEGFPVTKAMLMPVKREGLKTFYFSTNTSSNKVKSYLINNQGSIYFMDKRFYRGVSLIGTVEVLTDENTKQMFWQTGDEQYYPLGVNDPDYCILKFTISKGRFYRSFKNDDFEI